VGNRTLEAIINDCVKLPHDGHANFAHNGKSISIYKDFEYEDLFDIHFHDDSENAVNLDSGEGFLGGVDIIEL